LDGDSKFKVIFVLNDDDLGDMSRAIQEDQILSTRLKGTVKGKSITLPSFFDVWKRNKRLGDKVLASEDPHEAKWKLSREFGYKMATTFMPLFAKAIYEHFDAETVLDPCGGWGDRLIAAAASPQIKKYVSFDPNRALRPGYAQLMSLMGHDMVQIDETRATFDNGFEVHVSPFELGAQYLADESFDLVMTSPPFFDYEVYSPTNPTYRNWIDDFYKRLFVESARCVKMDGHVAIHIGDTSAGAIEPFLQHTVHKICNLRLSYKIGLRGTMSGKDRVVWVFKKVATRAVDASSAPQAPTEVFQTQPDAPTEIDEPALIEHREIADDKLRLKIRMSPVNFPNQGKTLAAIIAEAVAKPLPQAIDEFKATRLDYPTVDAVIAALYAQLSTLRREHGLTLQDARPEHIYSLNGVFVCLETSGSFALADMADPNEIADVLRPLVVRLSGYEPTALVGTRVSRLASRSVPIEK
jgi:tRNA1(Val) A37 N6-methylase TrmN6